MIILRGQRMDIDGRGVITEPMMPLIFGPSSERRAVEPILFKKRKHDKAAPEIFWISNSCTLSVLLKPSCLQSS